MWRAKRVQTALNGVAAPAFICESAGTGRQARLRGVCQLTWEFKSPLSHQKLNPKGLGFFVFPIKFSLNWLSFFRQIYNDAIFTFLLFYCIMMRNSAAAITLPFR